MDITSYLLGKNASGGGGGGDLSKYFTDTITEGNTSQTSCSAMIKKIPEDTVVSGKSLTYAFSYCINLTTIPLLDTSNVTNMQNMLYSCNSLTTIPLLDTSNVTNMQSMCRGCINLVSVPQLNTEKVNNISNLFHSCTSLITLPILNTSKVTNMQNAFYKCNSLSNDSLDNVLKMAIGATSYTGTKTLYYLGFRSENQPTATIEALPSYQAFLDAGWTIGY